MEDVSASLYCCAKILSTWSMVKSSVQNLFLHNFTLLHCLRRKISPFSDPQSSE